MSPVNIIGRPHYVVLVTNVKRNEGTGDGPLLLKWMLRWAACCLT